MPELPEVEVTRRGIAPHLEGCIVSDVVLRHSGLRLPFPPDLERKLKGKKILSTGRRGKYLLIHFDHGALVLHLGMSGHLRILPSSAEPRKHDHFDLVLGDRLLRLNDPRRFGLVQWHDAGEGRIEDHVLLRELGVEPLEEKFSGEILHARTRGRNAAIKQVLLAGDIVVGVGNIYASESLFRAGIDPRRAVSRISLARYEKLARAIRETLAAAIEKGGSSLRDFVAADGQSGYFQQTYFVYGRTGEPCRICKMPVRQLTQGQRSTFFCANCQK